MNLTSSSRNKLRWSLISPLTLTLCALPLSSQRAKSAVFDWGDFNSPISNVQLGDNFTVSNVDGTGVNFTFSFSQVLDPSTDSDYNTIISETNTAAIFPDDVTGNRNFESGVENVLYANNPLYVVGGSQNAQDAVVVTVTMSAPVIISNLIIGDIDRIQSAQDNSYEDEVTITSSLLAQSVGVGLSTTSSSIAINGNVAESISGGLLNSTSTESQIEVDTLGAVDTLTVIFRNSDADGGGFANITDGFTNNHWITFGTDARFTNFTVAVPEPSSTCLVAIGAVTLTMRRRREPTL